MDQQRPHISGIHEVLDINQHRDASLAFSMTKVQILTHFFVRTPDTPGRDKQASACILYDKSTDSDAFLYVFFHVLAREIPYSLTH